MLKNKNRIMKIYSVAAIAPYIDNNGMCYDIVVQKGVPEAFFDSFYRVKLPSFNSFSTNKITLTANDFQSIIKSHHSYINDVCQITGRPYDQVLVDFAEYHKAKEFLIQPEGFSGVMHKLSNGAFVSSAAVQSVYATASSHISGISGIALLGSSPGLIIFVPLIGGIFFGSLERIASNTPAQPALVLARDACLLSPKVAEIAYNEIFVGPLLRMFNIDAPLNITSMLKFGVGTKRIMGGVLNSTISVIAGSLPNLK